MSCLNWLLLSFSNTDLILALSFYKEGLLTSFYSDFAFSIHCSVLEEIYGMELTGWTKNLVDPAGVSTLLQFSISSDIVVQLFTRRPF